MAASSPLAILVCMKQIIFFLVSGVLAACAGSSEAPDGQAEADDRRGGSCISERIRRYTVLDEANVIALGTLRRSYHVVLQRRAWGLKSSTPMKLDSSTNRVCAGFGELVYVGNNREPERIRIRQITELNNEEYEDLLIRWGLLEPEIKTTPEPKEVEGAEIEELGSAEDDSSGN